MRRAFQLEIVRNPGLELNDFRYLAFAILMKNYGLSPEAALARARALDLREAKKLSLEDFAVTYFEIPLEELQKLGRFSAEQLAGLQNNRQKFDRNGKTWVRWFVHPLHRPDFMRKNFSAYEKSGPLRALLTSSRSMILKDLETGDEWSQKSSLKKAQGPFRNKIYPPAEAIFHFQLSKIIAGDSFLRNKFFSEESYTSLESHLPGQEPFSEGQIARSLAPYRSGESIQALATLFDPRIAVELAQKNGFGSDWPKFLAKKVVPELGRVVGYLYEKYGMAHNSLHSQNVMVRLDQAGRFLGILVRDPDFWVGLDKYSELFGETAAQALTEKSSLVRLQQNVPIDFSIMNGMTVFNDNLQEVSALYRRLGIDFATAILETVSGLRGLSLSKDVLRRTVSQEIKVDSNGNGGLRLSVRIQGKDIDQWLLMKEPSQLAPTEAGPKLAESVNDAKTKILDSITDFKDFDRSQNDLLIPAWQNLVQELIQRPSQSHLHQILTSNDGQQIQQLILILNENKHWPASEFFRTIIERYSAVLQQNHVADFFLGHFDESLMRLFLAKAPSHHLSAIWFFAKTNKLLSYPQDILNRFFVRLEDPAFQRIRNEIEENQHKSPAMRDDSIFMHAERLKMAIDVRFRVLASFDAKAMRKHEKSIPVRCERALSGSGR